MDSENTQETSPNLKTILDAINGLEQRVNQSINDLEQRMNERFNNVEARLTLIENDVRQVKEMQFVFENEFDRLQAIIHQSLNLAHENRADVRIMRKEIAAWAQDVRNLQRQPA